MDKKALSADMLNPNIALTAVVKIEIIYLLPCKTSIKILYEMRTHVEYYRFNAHKKSACGTSTPLPLTHEGLGLFFALIHS